MNYSFLCGALMVVSLLVFLGIRLIDQLERWRRWALGVPALAAYAALLILQPRNWILSNVFVLLVSIVAGALIGRTISSRSALIAFCIAGAMVDILSYSFGPTDALVQGYRSGDNRLLQYVTLSIRLNAWIIPIAGIEDLIIMGGIFAGLRRLGAPAALALIAPLGGLLLALVVGLLAGGIYAIPFIAAIVIAYLLYEESRSRPANTVP